MNILKSLVDRLDETSRLHKMKSKRSANDEDTDDEVDDEEHSDTENETNKLLTLDISDDMTSNDLIMDGLPESTRFTTTNTLEQLDKIGVDLSILENDCVDEDEENETRSINNNDNDNEDDGLHLTQEQPYQRINLYVQKNSRLKLILLSYDNDENEEETREFYKIENFIRIWQNIVSNFSNLEYEIINQERANATSSNVNAYTSSSGTLSPTSKAASKSLIEPQSSNTSHPNYSCIIDRNRIFKYQSPMFQLLNKSIKLTANVNLYYELIRSMPELSSLEVGKKGYLYSYLKQNTVTLSSSTLQQQVSTNSASASNAAKHLAKSSNNTPSPLKTINSQSDFNSMGKSIANNKHQLRSASASIDSTSTKIDYELLIDRLAIAQSQMPSSNNRPSSSISYSSLNPADSTSNLLNYLQHGDIFIKCTPNVE